MDPVGHEEQEYIMDLTVLPYLSNYCIILVSKMFAKTPRQVSYSEPCFYGWVPGTCVKMFFSTSVLSVRLPYGGVK